MSQNATAVKLVGKTQELLAKMKELESVRDTSEALDAVGPVINAFIDHGIAVHESSESFASSKDYRRQMKVILEALKQLYELGALANDRWGDSMLLTAEMRVKQVATVRFVKRHFATA